MHRCLIFYAISSCPNLSLFQTHYTIYASIGTNIAKNKNYDRAYAYNTAYCLPTAAQWSELINSCTWTETTVSGTKGFNVTTCRDQLKLARRILTMPRILRYTSTKIGEVTDGYGKQLRFVNHNNVLVKDKRKVMNPDGSEAVDGLKTGYIDAGGSSVVLTGRRKGKRAIVIVLGSATSGERDENAARLLEDALGAIAW